MFVCCKKEYRLAWPNFFVKPLAVIFFRVSFFFGNNGDRRRNSDYVDRMLEVNWLDFYGQSDRFLRLIAYIFLWLIARSSMLKKSETCFSFSSLKFFRLQSNHGFGGRNFFEENKTTLS
jgi:hypothetical protein